jgi:Rha family phage regulatory protein
MLHATLTQAAPAGTLPPQPQKTVAGFDGLPILRRSNRALSGRGFLCLGAMGHLRVRRFRKAGPSTRCCPGTLLTGGVRVQLELTEAPMSAQITRADSALISPEMTTTSQIIAEKFGKRHDDVLKRIRAVTAPEIGDVDQAVFNARNFAAVEYTDSKGERRPSYELTRDGFALLVMGFTGKRAMAWKIKFLEAFNSMEAQLRTPVTPDTAQPGYMDGIRAALRHKSPDELAAWAKGEPDKISQVITYLETTLLDPELDAEARRELARVQAIASRIRGDTPDTRQITVKAHLRRSVPAA